MSQKTAKASRKTELAVPAAHNWNTTDDDEINRRRQRARTESFAIANTDARHPIFSNFQVKSGSGLKYSVEVRDLAQRQFGCDCVDFRINGLGTCKHAEAVLNYLEARYRRLFRAAAQNGSSRLDIVPDAAADTLRLMRNGKALPRSLQEWFNADGQLLGGSPEAAVEQLSRVNLPSLRISQEVAPWLAARLQAAERKELRREYELKVQSGEWPPHETLVPLFPYQREGMLHLAFTERALLADEMGLGQDDPGHCRVRVVAPVGQGATRTRGHPGVAQDRMGGTNSAVHRCDRINWFDGPRHQRLQAYANPPFFTIVNYEQMMRGRTRRE